MYDRRFFSTRLGQAALLSIAAMVSLNIFALTNQVDAPRSFASVAASAPIQA